MSRSIRQLVFAAVLAALAPFAAGAAHPGFIITADDRFDPAIQRLMAELELAALPLERGQFYYLYPIGITPRLEGAQIRYLEHLLDKRADEDAAAAVDALERADAASAPEKTPEKTAEQ
ncbi:MAG: hypothetical protein AB7I04_02025 [Pseudomonadales bacterium]